MTKERIVNLIIDHYVRQKKRFGISFTGTCKYKYEKDNVECSYCAIGFLVNKSHNSDKFFDKFNDDSSMQCTTSIGREIFRYIYMEPNKENAKFLGDLQDIHDRFAILHHQCPELELNVCDYYSPKITDANDNTFVDALKSLVKD
tara:strand:+ start:3007 stop:3441 length:435 start_codon:yes stop_codon:yes gene_type:complete